MKNDRDATYEEAWQSYLDVERTMRVTNFLLSFGPHKTDRCCFCLEEAFPTLVDGPIMCDTCLLLVARGKLPLQRCSYDDVAAEVQRLRAAYLP